MVAIEKIRHFLVYASDPDHEQEAMSAWRRVKGYLTLPQQRRILTAWSKCLQSKNPLYIEYACQRTASEIRYQLRRRNGAGTSVPVQQ